ncbi:MAG TPA: glycoside hydrolase family 3 N-terminal domain-containing protein, partial [bacterium]
TLDEKISLVVGDRMFFIRSVPRLNLSEVFMADATQGVHIRDRAGNFDLTSYRMEKSTAFPCPIALASTWNEELAYQYAEAVGEECRAGGIGILLGPGMNQYRHSQCGRNFEYFGEDPFLRARMIEAYVKGVQGTGTVATLKHFVANNTDFYRRKSNSVVDERALHEIYLPPFKAGIDAGAMAVMTSYNLLNGEWCGQSKAVINGLLRKRLGFDGLVMTDWWSVYDGEKLVRSGQDLEMPDAVALKDLRRLIDEEKVKVADVDRMVKSILSTCFAMRLYDRKKDPAVAGTFENHEQVALQTAREAVVLLRNHGGILPVRSEVRSILLTGDFVDSLAAGGGSAWVEGYNNRLMLDELKRVFGDRLRFAIDPSPDEIRSAELVLCNVGTRDSEGWDRPFALPDDQEKKVKACVDGNPHTVVIVTSGSGVRMTDWFQRAGAVLYAWYGGQTGNRALAEILTGETNPSGKLPITIEKEFEHTPGFGYIPPGESLYSDWNREEESERSVYDVHYREGVFVGYRWFEKRDVKPLVRFGHGLSYTRFDYGNLDLSKKTFHENDTLTVSFTVENTGGRRGMETAQLYIRDVTSSLPRPVKELKGFHKVDLEPGQSKVVRFRLDKSAFAFWNPATGDWFIEKGKFMVLVGSSSGDIRLKREIELR